jgi:5-methyltetrahydrofolate--homocysteine methyltransferase
MADLKILIDAVVDMEEDKALSLTKEYLEKGVNPVDLFNAFQSALEEIGRRFEKQVYFIPELIMSGEVMKTASELIKPYLKEDAVIGPKLGKFLMATVEGDIHDIGKNIATMMLEITGFDVKDIGVDVPSERIISEAEEFEADIIGLSGLLTIAFDPMKQVVDELKAKGLRDKYKVIIGGGQMDDQVREYTGADAFVTDAVAGLNICKGWIQ